MPDSRTDSKWHWAIGGAVLLVLGVMLAIVLLYTLQPDEDHSSVVTLLIGLTSTSVLAMLALLKTLDNATELHANTATTEATAATVEHLANGSMDAKIRLAVAEVLHPEAIDPGVRPQLEVDRETRARLDQMVADELRRRLDE